jgi:glutamyl-tRNA synthetase
MIKTRFAPSPTGLLHVGSVRPALVNYLFAKRHNAQFILRIDDTDLSRSTDYFKEQILIDLAWLGLSWDDLFFQSARIDRYNNVVADLLDQDRLYQCFETPEELDIKRKLMLSNGKPPIYDRAGLHLSNQQKNQYLAQGRKPHYRFKMLAGEIAWHDLIRQNVKYNALDISDPIVIREDGSFTYMLCSAIDDADYNITHIFRGQDHINNTAIQIQMLEAMGASIPIFGHLSFLTAKDDKISKRVGGFELATLRNNHINPMAISSFFTYIGTSKALSATNNMNELIDNFEVSSFSASPTIYNPQDLVLLNHKLLIQLTYSDVKCKLAEIGATEVDEEFWMAIRANLDNISQLTNWWNICKNQPSEFDHSVLDKDFCNIAARTFPEGQIDQTTWNTWTKKISEQTGKKGKNLFMPLRIALTGLDHGPEMRILLTLISREEILKRLKV